MSPVDEPLIEQEPLVDFGRIHVHVFVQTSHHEDLVVVVNWLRSEELLWLLQRALVLLNFIRFRVEAEAVADPALVTAKNQNLSLSQHERANRVTRRPLVVLVDEVELLPPLVVNVRKAVQSLNRVQRGLCLAVSARDREQVPVLHYAQRVEVSALVKFSDLVPLVLGDVVELSLARHVVRVLGADSVDEVLSLIVEAPVEVSQLVAALAVLHGGFDLHLVSQLVEHQRGVGNNSSDFVFLQLSTNDENLILSLNAGEAARHYLSVLNSDGCGVLGLKFVDQHLLERVVVVVKSGLLSLKDEVRLKREHVVQEPSKLVDFAPHINLRSGVVRTESVMVLKLVAKLCELRPVKCQESLLLKNVEELRGAVHLLLLVNLSINVFFDLL